ncbi:MAG TPA: YbaB/EbfC family nucleoid-associated protein [Candidatus Avoscillospira avicola]|uniref:Nucleoid-associated protein IAA53_00945 n=1 Tax=Candidatus Avoscillospira avicola TaxID=2840706 RepID=A0A9D1APS6_9FIRM|nr:YbaB/EbfC family nucleoid-associated protein [Candidatus Avoscillospira avicola]
MAKGGYRGGMPMGGMNMNMIKQAQKMQQEMLKMQQEMETREYEATAGGGMITAAVNGKYELLRLTIDPEAVDPEDVEMLQDMVIAAVNEAMRKAQAESAATMGKLTGGLNLGGLL